MSYNRASSGTNNGVYKLVCDTRLGAANYTGASRRLCSRKRQHCWWTNEASVGSRNCHTGYSYGSAWATINLYYWTEDVCREQVQVNIDGRVSIVHPGSKSVRRVGANSGAWFRVRWRDGRHPTAATGCADSCEIVAGEAGETCLCGVAVTQTAAFSDPAAVPNQAEVEERLRIGAPAPDSFDETVYTECATLACAARSPAVRIFTRGTAASPTFDEFAIFSVVVNQTAQPTNGLTNGRTLYLANKESTVSIANGSVAAAFSFRNPPRFMALVDPSERDALDETEALLDHLFYHQNVAPFISHLLIQRLVTSNPSPRYVAAASAAFSAGAYGNVTYSGRYGDLGAMVAAILLDREAQSLVLDADPNHGQLREPLVKLYHFMRAMEYRPREHSEVDLTKTLIDKIGQQLYKSPSVFVRAATPNRIPPDPSRSQPIPANPTES